VLGPTLGGWLTDTFSWRYAFYINIPVGILAVIMISRFVHDPPYIKNAKVGPFDNIGFGLLMVWTGCLQIVLDKGQEDDWFGAVWVRWAVAALVVALLGGSGTPGPSQRPGRSAHPQDRNFRTGCFMIAMLGMCIYITIAILPLYYQEILGYTAFTAGLVVFPARHRLLHRLAHHRHSSARASTTASCSAPDSRLWPSAPSSSAPSTSTSAPTRC
jgi:MFS transporter, DHA2 family, multidrug resistance protein